MLRAICAVIAARLVMSAQVGPHLECGSPTSCWAGQVAAALLRHLGRAERMNMTPMFLQLPLVLLCTRRKWPRRPVKWGEVGTDFAITRAATCATVVSRTSRPCPGHRECSEE
jgi:hypothetical protein